MEQPHHFRRTSSYPTSLTGHNNVQVMMCAARRPFVVTNKVHRLRTLPSLPLIPAFPAYSLNLECPATTPLSPSVNSTFSNLAMGKQTAAKQVVKPSDKNTPEKCNKIRSSQITYPRISLTRSHIAVVLKERQVTTMTADLGNCMTHLKS